MRAPTRTHQGWALPTVMAVLGLGALSALSLSRGVWLHANLLRSDGDEWRARGAAEALLREAEQDLLAGFAANKDARHSTPATDAMPSGPFIPHTLAGLAQLKKALPAGLCREGICAPGALEPTSAAVWAQRLNTAARYGQYTGGAAVSFNQINPVLADTAAIGWRPLPTQTPHKPHPCGASLPWPKPRPVLGPSCCRPGGKLPATYPQWDAG